MYEKILTKFDNIVNGSKKLSITPLNNPDFSRMEVSLMQKIYKTEYKQEFHLSRIKLAAAGLLIAFISAASGLIAGSRSAYQTVYLYLEAPHAESVELAGSWNGWDTGKHRLSDTNKNGTWEIRIKLKKGSQYYYQFLINGEEWTNDPGSPFNIDDGFGGKNSVLNL